MITNESKVKRIKKKINEISAADSAWEEGMERVTGVEARHEKFKKKILSHFGFPAATSNGMKILSKFATLGYEQILCGYRGNQSILLKTTPHLYFVFRNSSCSLKQRVLEAHTQPNPWHIFKPSSITNHSIQPLISIIYIPSTHSQSVMFPFVAVLQLSSSRFSHIYVKLLEF